MVTLASMRENNKLPIIIVGVSMLLNICALILFSTLVHAKFDNEPDMLTPYYNSRGFRYDPLGTDEEPAYFYQGNPPFMQHKYAEPIPIQIDTSKIKARRNPKHNKIVAVR